MLHNIGNSVYVPSPTTCACTYVCCDGVFSLQHLLIKASGETDNKILTVYSEF